MLLLTALSGWPHSLHLTLLQCSQGLKARLLCPQRCCLQDLLPWKLIFMRGCFLWACQVPREIQVSLWGGFAFASVGVLWFSLIWDQMISLARIPLPHELCKFCIHMWLRPLSMVGNFSHSQPQGDRTLPCSFLGWVDGVLFIFFKSLYTRHLERRSTYSLPGWADHQRANATSPKSCAV